MKIVITILIFISAVIPINAQRITREYNNVSLSEALRQLNEQELDRLRADDFVVELILG